MKRMEHLSGVIPLYKPKGMTSHDCVHKLRGILGIQKIGHTGTLDPEVDGVLAICIGRATKIAEFITGTSKTYTGVIALGKATTTEDASGEVVEEKEVRHTWTRADIERVFTAFTGTIQQTPPIYSAVKVNGKKLYEYARAGIAVERPTRTVEIYRLEIAGDDEEFSTRIPFTVDCSKGTYVRTLAVDIGRALGYPAHLEALTRTRSGPFALKECVTFADIERAAQAGDLASVVLDIGRALSGMKKWTVDGALEKKVLNGAVLSAPKGFQNEVFSVYNKHGECLAIYRPHPSKAGLVKPAKVIAVRT